MTNKEFTQSVAATCKKVMKAKNFRYVDIEINYGLPYVSVGMNGCEFFAQGEDAASILEEVIKTADKADLSILTCLVWHLESAGVFSKN